MESDTGETLYFLWFAVLIFFLVVVFIGKLKFDKVFEKRAERRRMLSYSKVKLSPDDEGMSRTLKVRKVKDL